MRDFVFDSALIRAEDDTVAVAHALRKMNKKAGDKGMYQQQRLVRLD